MMMKTITAERESVNVWRRDQTKYAAADSREHEVPLPTQAADAMPTSVKTSRGEDGAKESDDDVDEAEDNNDHKPRK